MKNYLDKFTLEKKTSIIIGGSGLLGKSITDLFLSAKSKVINLDIAEYKVKNKNYFFEYFDCSDVNNLENNFKKIIKKYKTPNIYLNCSYPITKDWYKSTFSNNFFELTRENIDIHLNTYVWTSSYVANLMKNKKIKGSIILFGSIYGNLGQNLSIYKKTRMHENMNYSSIKGGIINHSRQLASYYGKYGLRVNALSPGGIKGHVAGSKLKQNSVFINNYKNQTPLARLGKPEEVALSALFLASDASSYISGTNFLVDGGWSSI